MTSTSPDEIRSDIEATRARLGEDLDELSDRVSPQKVAGRTAQDLRRRVSSATETVRPKVAATAGTATEKARQTADQAKATVRRQLDAHPQVAAKVSQVRDTAGGAVSAGRQKAAANPRVTGSAAAAAALLALLLFVLRHRRHGTEALD